MFVSACLLLGVASAAAQSAKALTNEDILVLVKVGLADEVIIAKIQQAPEEALNVSTETVLNLSKAGVGQGVIKAMVERAAKRSPERSTQTVAATSSVDASTKEGSRPPASEQCTTNFTEEVTHKGILIKDKTYKTFAEVRGFNRLKTIDKSAQVLALHGYKSVTANRDAGVLAAIQPAANHKEVSINMVVSDVSPTLLRVELTLALTGGLTTSAAAVKKEFCSITSESLQP